MQRPFRSPRGFRRTRRRIQQAWFSLPDGGAETGLREQLFQSWQRFPAMRLPPVYQDEAHRRYRFTTVLKNLTVQK